LGRRYDAALTGAGLNVTQLAVLRRVVRFEGEPLSHIAMDLEMDRTTLYRAIAPMARDGWLTLSRGRSARARNAKITRKGRQLLDKANAAWDGINERVVAAFGRAEWRAMQAELTRLAECAESIRA
jgi:DNA-binding MarR family transcriptional regulator